MFTLRKTTFTTSDDHTPFEGWTDGRERFDPGGRKWARPILPAASLEKWAAPYEVSYHVHVLTGTHYALVHFTDVWHERMTGVKLPDGSIGYIPVDFEFMEVGV